MTYLGDKSVGSVVKIRENGVTVNYLIVHKGRPSSLYDYSCDGVWVVRQKAYGEMYWHSSNISDYEKSDIHSWLNNTFYYKISSDIRAAIKGVRIPYRKGDGSASTQVQSGSSGLYCKVFLLSAYEVGFTTSDSPATPVDGAKLSYFSDKNSRICTSEDGTNQYWWLRSPYLSALTGERPDIISVHAYGNYSHWFALSADMYVRPAFILPNDLYVDSSGYVVANSTPTISSDKTGNLGTLTEGFTCNYSVNDVDSSDSVTVTLSMDGTVINTFTAVKGQQYTYSLTGADWLKVANGSHTFKITATDGKATATSTATFTRACDRLTTTLATPLAADALISACTLKVEGDIPEDAVCLYEVTNNAKDSSPVWEDCTGAVKSGFSHIFENKTAENGFAFNFRVTINRGSSNMGGYITKISGGFE